MVSTAHNPIHIFLPGFYENFRPILYLHDRMEQSPQYFNEGMQIAAAYGCFPGYKIISSTTKCLYDVGLIQEELEKDYALVVLDSATNNTEELFALDHKKKIELIANHYCADNCPRRKEHYTLVGEAQLEYDSVDFPCDNIRRSFREIQNNRSFISPEMIYETYVPSGFTNFKLDGRGFKKEKVLESFAYYLARPEYRTLVQEELFARFT